MERAVCHVPVPVSGCPKHSGKHRHVPLQLYVQNNIPCTTGASNAWAPIPGSPFSQLWSALCLTHAPVSAACTTRNQLQERLKKFQENVRSLVDEPLRAAEATFKKEKAELQQRLAAAETETAKHRQENRGKTRHIAELEAALEVGGGLAIVVTSYCGH